MQSVSDVLLPYLIRTSERQCGGGVLVEETRHQGEMLKEIFSTNTRQNERILDLLILQHDIDFDGEDVPLSDGEMEEEEEEEQ